MLSELLKGDSLQAHQELEKVFIQKIKLIDSRTTYAALLKRFYGYFRERFKDALKGYTENKLAERTSNRTIKNTIRATLFVCGKRRYCKRYPGKMMKFVPQERIEALFLNIL
jgi:heme oxygenase